MHRYTINKINNYLNVLYTFLYSCSRYEYEHLKDLKEKKERKTIPN